MRSDDRFTIEVDGEIAGILVQATDAFIFHASADWAWPRQGDAYADPVEAQQAITAFKRSGRTAAA